MDIMLISILSILLLAVVIFLVFYILNIKKKIKEEERLLLNAKEVADNIIEKAEAKALALEKEAKINAKSLKLEMKEEADKEVAQRRNEISKQEKRIFQKENLLDKREEKLEKSRNSILKQEEELVKRERKIEENFIKREKNLEKLEEEKEKVLLETANITKKEAKEEILRSLEMKLNKEKADILRKYEDYIKANKNKIAKEMIATAIQKCAADHTSETTVTVVPLPSDEIKGRIIGKEGRNIKSLEMLTGAQFIIDETPEAIAVSAFDPIRREVAKVALEKLVADGRIHPAKIEEMVEKAVEEISEIVRAAGENAMKETGVTDLNSEEIELLGKLKFRTSYGQNVLTHSIEVANLAGLLAEMVGGDVKSAIRGGLLHDIGKALDHDADNIGTHVELGVEVLKRAKETKKVINAVEAHHGDVPTQSVEAVLVIAADAISSSRPGARRDTFEAYIRRLESIEAIANDYPGVKTSYAIQAGREVRLIVDPDKLSDDDIKVLSRNVATRIENEVVFPGKIKVMVVRELRDTTYANQSKVNRV